MSYLKTLYDWLKRILIWLYDGKIFWLFLFLIMCILPFKCLYIYFGVVLQLIGIITIVIGINNKIRLFNNENPLKYHLKYFKQFPSFKPKNHVLNLSDTIHGTSSLSGKLSQGVREPEQTIPDIIRYIDEKLLQINQQISNTRTELNDQITGLKKQLSDQKQQLDSNITDIQKKLILNNISDISLELFGASCIAAGLIFSILPLL